MQVYVSGYGHQAIDNLVKNTEAAFSAPLGQMSFSILTGSDALTACNFLQVSDNCHVTRGNSLKLSKVFSRTDVRRFSFSQRVVNEWNSLPDWVVKSDSVHSFKVNIDKYFTNTGRL